MTQARTRRLILTTVVVVAMAGLVGCSSSAPEATNDVETNAAVNVAAPVAAPPVENLAENVTENASEEAPPPEKPIAANEQMMDDASATGMTSHVSRDQEPAPEPQN